MDLNDDDIESKFSDFVANINEDSGDSFCSLLATNTINYTTPKSCLKDNSKHRQATPQQKGSKPTPIKPHSSPKISSLKKYSSLKLVQKETNRPNNVEKAASDCSLKSCLTEKQNKSNCITETESNSIRSKFRLVSPLNNSMQCLSDLDICVTDAKSPSQYYNPLKTPVGRCSLSSVKTSYKLPLKDRTIARRRPSNKTPTLHMSYKIVERPRPLIGVKIIQTSISKRISLQLHETKPVSNRISVNKDMSVVEDDDRPCTQPISEILRGVVAYVEIRLQGSKEYANSGTASELQSLGARVEANFTKKVTHCFFQDGKMSTYKRAVDWKVPLVCVLWIEECKAQLRQVPLKGYEPYCIPKFKEALLHYRPRTREQEKLLCQN